MMLHDIIGGIGVILIVVAYFLLQFGIVRSVQLNYSVLNAIGAAMIMFSLLFEFNASAFVLEGFWFVLSVYGIVRWSMAKARPATGSS